MGSFFRRICAIGDLEALREDAHLLTYHYNGISYADVLDMTRRDREWHLERLIEQFKAEEKAHKRAARS